MISEEDKTEVKDNGVVWILYGFAYGLLKCCACVFIFMLIALLLPP